MRAETRGGVERATLRRWLPVAVATAILLGAVGVVLGRDLISPTEPKPRPTANAFARFRDAQGGFSISYPARWRRIPPRNPDVRLLAEGEGSSMLVRMADIGIQIGPESVKNARKLTDRLVRAAGRVKLLRSPTQVTLGGLPGYLYLYTFPVGATGQQAAHAHYFLFRGQTLITVVFQTQPPERLPRLAPLFDRLGETLRVTPG